MWTHAVRFPSPVVVVDDEDGQESTVDNWGKPVPADFQDTSRSDEVAASQLGYTADQNIKVHASNYTGQGYLQDVGSGEVYDIKRTFEADKSGYIVLSCQLRERGKAVHYG